jgi:hypothetical protein
VSHLNFRNLKFKAALLVTSNAHKQDAHASKQANGIPPHSCADWGAAGVIVVACARPSLDLTRTEFTTYRDTFINARLTRARTRVLEIVLHTDGGTPVFYGHTNGQFAVAPTRAATL